MSGRSKTYIVWQNMIQRCTDPNATNYQNYGARGISVCEAWRLFPQFLADMGECPTDRSLDRIDVNGNYEPGNCRWITIKQQANNTRANRVIEHRGYRMTLQEWADRTGLHRRTISNRLDRLGWTVAEALSQPSSPSPRNLR